MSVVFIELVGKNIWPMAEERKIQHRQDADGADHLFPFTREGVGWYPVLEAAEEGFGVIHELVTV